MASGTALVYDNEMTSHKLLWDDPICDIEVPERLSSCYERLKCYNLVERCISVPVREGTEEEIMLVHSLDYLEIVKRTPKMTEEELRKTSADYESVYFHLMTYRCAKLAVGATLELVDAVMSGKSQNGMALIRPPGHHSQRNAANGFCIFNNVAIAAKYAKRKYGLQRILIVDWDVHHGQGIQYIFDEDPSVLYFSWHRFEHQQYWPSLSESNYDAAGQGKGRGFNINVPWNKIGMGNSDYVAAFLHVLLPLAFEFDPELVLVSAGYDSGIGDPEGQMSATPECFAHLTHLLMHLAKGKLCVVLEGGYHLRSLSESVCMTLKTLLGDPLPRLSGEMAPCLSAVESIHNVRAVHKPHWECLMFEDTVPLLDLSTSPYQMGEAKSTQTGAQLLPPQESGKANSAEAIKTDRFLELHMKKIAFPIPRIKTTVAVDEKERCLLPPSVQVEKATDPKELKAILSGFDAELVKEEKVFNSLVNMLAVLDKIIKKEVTNGLAVSSVASLSSAVALKHCHNLKIQKVLCVFVGDMDMKIDLDDGEVLLINVDANPPTKSDTKYNISVNWKKDVETNNFFSAALGFILPVAYSYQPDLTVIVVGPKQSVGKNGITLLISLLQGLAQSHILTLIQDTEVKLLQDIIKPLTGDFIPYFGTYAPDLKENVQRTLELREQFQQEWKLLQCSAKVSTAER
ncbi:polyamine deacetylase HDAC10 isoform X1 [Rhineura floridana]|uniref:polyamine deacetylase HDAC10 isoform X1 n=1 Tax=Rhineura floridana TaxID=261503 RepID=UPI002AC868F9|nr:polyamine deacetylase HDAC10 isoform X1 [Rhineura floridana]XP_061496194.1 polyamine deacetylase HDAC10 isoform X1 [Rhineura floridana]